ncbi:MAG: PepSY domain-containing protein [Pseudorhodobacter sp.]|nr:MAG: PepSY domain-containing protein [Pseudorhodobacter sp.]
MKLYVALALGLTLTPFAALALPAVGDVVGTTPEAATAALEAAGCKVESFEAEDGKIEAKCTDAATGKLAEIYIDPKTGAVAEVKAGD